MIKQLFILISIFTLFNQISAFKKAFILNNITARTYTPSPIQKRSNLQSTPLPTTQFVPFNATIACHSPRMINGKSICIWIQSAITRTLKRIAQVIYLPQTVNVDCTIQQKGTSLVLASAAPTQFLQFTDDESLLYNTSAQYLYPSSLAKQYLPNDPMILNLDSDIRILINGDANWWFYEGNVEPDLKSSPVQTGSKGGRLYDMEQVVMHELLHGLGFISGWFPWIDDLPLSFVPGSLDNAGLVYGMQSSYIFDRYLVDVINQTYMNDYAKIILKTAAEITNKTKIYSDWITLFAKSDAGKLSRQLYTDIATLPQSLISLFSTTNQRLESMAGDLPGNDMGYVVLHTPLNFTSGSSISHMDSNVYSGTSDYLMRPFGTTGVGIDGFSPTNRYGPIGSGVLHIMKSMGYATAIVVD